MLDIIKSYPEIVIGLISTFLGYFIGILVSYSKFAQDLAYIRGKLQGLEKLYDDLKDMHQRIDTVESLAVEARARTKVLETHVFKRELQ